MKLSVVIITFNEESNIQRTLASAAPLVAGGHGEIIVVDSGSTDRTCEIAREFGAKVFVEQWKGFAAQKNSAIEKASGDWILSLDADEEVDMHLAGVIGMLLREDDAGIKSTDGFWISRRNLFLSRWIKHGGFYPDRKLRLFRRGMGHFKGVPVHETVELNGKSYPLDWYFRPEPTLIHHAYPTLSGYIEHMNRYSSLGSEAALGKGQTSRSIFAFLWNVWLRPRVTFFYNYVLRLGFLDGREGLLLHLYHAAYVSWKYAKAWEKANSPQRHRGTEER